MNEARRKLIYNGLLVAVVLVCLATSFISSNVHKTHASSSSVNTVVKHYGDSASADLVKLQHEVERLHAGSFTLNAPTDMKTGSTGRVSVAITAAPEPNQAVVESFSSRAGTKTITDEIKVAPTMKTTLTSGDFIVTPLSSETQSITTVDPTHWDWDVMPKRTGTLHLHLVSTIMLGSLTHDLATEDRDIVVTVNYVDEAKRLLKANVPLVWGIAAGAFVGVVAMFRKKNKTTENIP